MREFFRSWKRKVGVVTLVIACVVMMEWMRSYVAMDVLRFGGNKRQQGVVSLNGELCWWAWNVSEVDWSLQPNERPISDAVAHELTARRETSTYGDGRREWIIPHRVIVLPLTLFSAYLLLSKPRPAKPSAQQSI